MDSPKGPPYKHVQVGKPPADNTKAIIDSQDKKGGSNAGTHEDKKYYAGPSGGAPKYTFPIDTLKDAEDAMRMRGKAPNPAGIKRAVLERWPSLSEKYSQKVDNKRPGVKRKSKKD